MNDYYLKSGDAESMLAALNSLPEDGVTIDVIGIAYRQIDEETFEPVEGFYANVRSVEPLLFPEGIDLMQPETPWRIFA